MDVVLAWLGVWDGLVFLWINHVSALGGVLVAFTRIEGGGGSVILPARQNLLGSLMREALVTRADARQRAETGVGGESSPAEQRPSEAQSADAWDDPLAFIQAEEPDDAGWFHDDSLDTATDRNGERLPLVGTPREEVDPSENMQSNLPVRGKPSHKWSDDEFADVLDEEEAEFEDWTEEEEPLVELDDLEAVPVDAFAGTTDEYTLDWSQKFGIPHHEIVREVATGIALKVGWGEPGMEVIACALSPYRAFGKVRADLLRFIRGKRVSVRELRLVTELRGAWLEGGYCRGWVHMRNRFGTRPVDCKINLDWWLGLRLLRGLRTEDVDEVRVFLEDCFEEWTGMRSACVDIDLALMDNDSPELRAMMHFHRYLHLILQRMIGSADWRRIPAFIDYRLFPREEGIRDCAADRMDPVFELSFND